MVELLQSKRSSLLGSLVSQIMTLKVALVIAAALVLVEGIVLIALGFRKPIVIGLSNGTSEVMQKIIDEQLTAPQVRAFIYDVLARKFPIKPNADRLLPVCRFFTEGLAAACSKEIKSKTSFIPQEVLVKEFLWNDKAETVRLELRRFATFNGAISAVDSVVLLKITQRARTIENPWGIFIDSWREEVRK
jgi:hypothetical protein